MHMHQYCICVHFIGEYLCVCLEPSGGSWRDLPLPSPWMCDCRASMRVCVWEWAREAPSYYAEFISAPKGSPLMMPGHSPSPLGARWVMAGMILKFFRRKGGTGGLSSRLLNRWSWQTGAVLSECLREGCLEDEHFSTSKCDPRKAGFPDLLPPGIAGNLQAVPLESAHVAAVPRTWGTMLASAGLPLLSSILMMGHVPPNSTGCPPTALGIRHSVYRETPQVS